MFKKCILKNYELPWDYYIRTQTNIYKVSKKLKNNTYLIRGKWHVDFNKVIKESADVRYLCDIFVEEFPIYRGNDVIGIDHQFWEYDPSTGKFNSYITGEEIDDVKDFYDRKYGFYGAVWSASGLHYKIKLNKNGIFELTD